MERNASFVAAFGHYFDSTLHLTDAFDKEPGDIPESLVNDYFDRSAALEEQLLGSLPGDRDAARILFAMAGIDIAVAAEASRAALERGEEPEAEATIDAEWADEVAKAVAAQPMPGPGLPELADTLAETRRVKLELLAAMLNPPPELSSAPTGVGPGAQVTAGLFVDAIVKQTADDLVDIGKAGGSVLLGHLPATTVQVIQIASQIQLPASWLWRLAVRAARSAMDKIGKVLSAAGALPPPIEGFITKVETNLVSAVLRGLLDLPLGWADVTSLANSGLDDMATDAARLDDALRRLARVREQHAVWRCWVRPGGWAVSCLAVGYWPAALGLAAAMILASLVLARDFLDSPPRIPDFFEGVLRAVG